MTITACWLLDADIFQEYRDELVAAIQADGHACKLIQAPKAGYSWEEEGCSYRQTFPKDACVIVHGDIALSVRVNREHRWTPGAYCTIENFACSRYYAEFGQYLLNHDYIMLPFAELDRCKNLLFDALGKNGVLFIRPDSPLKIFTGQVASYETFEKDLEFMAFYEFPSHELVLVSSPKSIAAEWRFVVSNKKIIAGTQYSENGEGLSRPEYHSQAFQLAERIASNSFSTRPRLGDGYLQDLHRCLSSP